MQPMEMYNLLKRQPFQPFRIYLDDGRTFEIRHPRLTLATMSRLVIGVPDPKDPDPWIAEQTYHVGWPCITRVEMLTLSPSA
jgi:hypothetical protein